MTKQATIIATPAKLKTGAWGARLASDKSADDLTGATITIRTRAGKTWQAQVERVIWTGSDKRTGEQVHLLATRSLGTARDRKPVQSAPTMTGEEASAAAARLNAELAARKPSRRNEPAICRDCGDTHDIRGGRCADCRGGW